MKAFVSYSHDDAMAAYLLTHILEDRGIECETDRKIPPGDLFRERIRKMIRQADVVVVLLTKSALQSHCVNQEIGCAIAFGKPIFPVSAKRDVLPPEMSEPIQSHELINTGITSVDIESFADKLLEKARTRDHLPGPVRLDGAIEGMPERTRFLAKLLDDLAVEGPVDGNERIQLLCQAAFSIFATPQRGDSDYAVYGKLGDQSREEVNLLQKERKALQDVVNSGKVEVSLLLWPGGRKYRKEYLKIRFNTLLRWMRENKDKPLLRYAMGKYEGPSRYVVVGRYCLYGVKTEHMAGYDLTLVKRRPSDVAKAVAQFNKTFEASYVDNATTIAQIKETRDRMLS